MVLVGFSISKGRNSRRIEYFNYDILVLILIDVSIWMMDMIRVEFNVWRLDDHGYIGVVFQYWMIKFKNGIELELGLNSFSLIFQICEYGVVVVYGME